MATEAFTATPLTHKTLTMLLKTILASLLLLSTSFVNAAPATIYVAPTIPYASPAPDGSTSPSQSCPWDTRLVRYLAKNSTLVAVNPSPMEAKGKKLILTATLGPNVRSGKTQAPSWIDVSGTLFDENGKALGDFGFRDDRYSGYLDDCSQAIRLAEGLGDSIAGWVEEPKPGIKIASTINTLREDTIDPEIKKNCPWNTELPSLLVYLTSGNVYQVAEDINTAKGKKLQLKIVDSRLLGGALYSGSKWIKVIGSLTENGHEIGSFVARRNSYRGWTGCGITSRLNNEIAYDIYNWLEKPSMKAYLGDADAASDALPSAPEYR
jgi:hypothetical protein